MSAATASGRRAQRAAGGARRACGRAPEPDGGRAVVDPRRALRVPPGVDGCRELVRLPPQGVVGGDLGQLRAFQATRALRTRPSRPRSAGLWSGAPPAARSMVLTSAPFRSNHARGSSRPGTTSSQRGLSSQPDSHGWQSSTRPPACAGGGAAGTAGRDRRGRGARRGVARRAARARPPRGRTSAAA